MLIICLSVVNAKSSLDKFSVYHFLYYCLVRTYWPGKNGQLSSVIEDKSLQSLSCANRDASPGPGQFSSSTISYNKRIGGGCYDHPKPLMIIAKRMSTLLNIAQSLAATEYSLGELKLMSADQLK